MKYLKLIQGSDFRRESHPSWKCGWHIGQGMKEAMCPFLLGSKLRLSLKSICQVGNDEEEDGADHCVL